jgi:heat shock protein HslJ
MFLIVAISSCRTIYSKHNSLQSTGWRLSEFVKNDKKEFINQDAVININFSVDKINGSSGCNTFFGSYQLEDKFQIKFGPIGSTKMICEDYIQKYEDRFLSNLDKVQYINIDENSLYLYEDEANYMIFHRFQVIDNGGLYSDSYTKSIWVASENADCQGVSEQKCLLIKESNDEDWSLFYDDIEGFDWEKGYEYELLVTESKVKNSPADASSIKWKLVKIISKEKQ